MDSSETTYAVEEDALLSAQGLLADVPTVSRDADVLRTLRQNARRTRTLVIDDDATGSQTVRGVALLFSFDLEELARCLEKPGSAAFVLTNSRSLEAREAARRNFEIGAMLPILERRLGGPVRLVSRSDSTLRGHFVAEIAALREARREGVGRDFDGVIFAPGYFEAGRVTIRQTHWARVRSTYVPVGETEFAKDADFAYRASDLDGFIRERLQASAVSGADGVVAEIAKLGLSEIRLGGVSRVREALSSEFKARSFAVVDGTTYADYEVVACAASELERDGSAFLYRTGPSFVTSLLGQDPPGPLDRIDVPAGVTSGGLVVVGSHVRLTNAQVEHARRHHELAVVELDALAVMDPAMRDRHVADLQARVDGALEEGDVLLVTSRSVVRSAQGLGVARRISDALVDIVHAVVEKPPRWIVAKGGITSHDIAERALGIRSAVVAGQVERGAISVVYPTGSLGATPVVPYVIFAGNVGGEDSLTRVIKRLNGAAYP